MAIPDREVHSVDGTPIAVFESGAAAPGTRPLLLVHGTTADHLTFRVAGPLLGGRRHLYAMDRRGRGASGDIPAAYAIEREFEDVAAVADAIAIAGGGPIDVVGHSYGGRCALGAALLTSSIARIVCYEGAPPRDSAPSSAYEPNWLLAALEDDLARGDLDGLLERFMRSVVGMDDDAVARFRTNAIWPLRVAAAPTILRELVGSNDAAAGLDALCAVTNPVLQVIGSASPPAFGLNARALDGRLADGRVIVIDGAAHAAHHTHADPFVAAVEAFLDDPELRM